MAAPGGQNCRSSPKKDSLAEIGQVRRSAQEDAKEEYRQFIEIATNMDIQDD